MVQLHQLVPLNYREEKARFFSDHSYNPQFIYSSPISADDLVTYGHPKEALLQLADTLVHRHPKIPTDTSKVLTQSEVTDRVATYISQYASLQGYKIHWSDNYIVRASVRDAEIRLHTQATFTEQSLIGLLHHEIGTHALRRHNDTLQPWHGMRKKFTLSPYLSTEEGLAVLHGLIANDHPSLAAVALRYLAVQKALHSSFAETHAWVAQYSDDAEMRWMITLKQKRGLEDTAQPGAYTKDLVYFEGAMMVWRWLVEHITELPLLYAGKIALLDAPRLKEIARLQKIVLPFFYTSDTAAYHAKILTIGEYNGLHL